MTDWFRLRDASAVPSPSLLIHPDRIEENLRRMIALAGGADRLRPHVKTHKLPQVVALKRAAGIRKFKCATIAEAEMVADADGEDVLMSYQVLGPNIDRWLTLQRRFPQTRFSVAGDDPGAIRALADAAQADGQVVEVLLDLNVGMNRTGITPGKDALNLVRWILESPALRFGGLHLYDGHLHQPDAVERKTAWMEAVAPAWAFRDQLLAAGIAVPRIVAGGTPTLPFFAQIPGVECSAGTPVLWDSGQPRNNPELDFLPAAVLLTRVISKPTPHRLCLDLGHKAVASEMTPPRVYLPGLEDATFVAHSEEHLVIESPQAPAMAVGDVLYAIPRHICPTVALHAEVLVVRDGVVTERWPVTARARRISI
ncbi:MAG: hypothetical protein RIS76_2579 [Verrucomicrobiota bacterium]|jgi:D-serine deaminase-like pyridoxal phosphate-dependent protein